MKDILVLTPKIKRRVAFTLGFSILICLTLQISLAWLNTNIANKDQDVRREADKVNALVVSDSFKIEKSYYQNFEVNDETVILPVKDGFEKNSSIPVWFHESNGIEAVKINFGKTSYVNDMIYSLNAFEVGSTLKNRSLLMGLSGFFGILLVSLMGYLLKTLSYLPTTSSVSDFNIIFGTSKLFSKSAPTVGALKSVRFTDFIVPLVLFVGTTITYWGIRQHDVEAFNLGSYALMFGTTASISWFIYFTFRRYDDTRRLFMRICWGRDLSNVEAAGIDWSDAKIRKKVLKWFKRKGADKDTLEIVVALLPTFSGPLKDLQEVAVHFKPDVK